MRRRLLAIAAVAAAATLAVWSATKRSRPIAVRVATTEGERSTRAGAELPPALDERRATDAAPAAGDSRAEGRSAAAAATVLRVRVLAAGAPVTEGTLECFATPRTFPEVRDDAWHRELPIRGEVTDVVLAGEFAEAFLVASSASGLAAHRRVERLRVVGNTRVTTGVLEREVEIVLDAASAGPVVRGRILVDGAPAVPSGFKVLLHYDTDAAGASVEQLLALQPKLAVVDRAHATYAVGPRLESARALWVTSEATAPMWIALPAAGDGADLVLDLACESGTTLHLRCLDAQTGRPLPGASVPTETLVVASTSGRRVTSRTYAVTRVADAAGECTIRGLPSQGTFRVTEPRQPLAESSAPQIQMSGAILLELRLVPDQARELWRDVRLTAPGDAGARVWGLRSSVDALVDANADRSTLAVRWSPAAAREERSSVRDGELSGEVWEARVPRAGEFAFWVERDRHRVSEVELVLVGSEREVGPIAFVRRAQHALALRWTDAPVGTRVDATALSTRGAEPLGRWTLADAAGERQLALDGPCVLNLALRDASGSEVLRQFDCDPLRDPVLAVDLCAARAVRVVLDVAAEPRRGAEQLVLFGTHARAGEHPVRASLQLVDGAAPSPAPLPPGDYFFRLIAPSAECVLGLARIDATSAVGELAVAWRGTRRRLEDAEQSAGASVVVESVGGRSLDFVPAELRTLRLPDAGADERVLCPDVLTYRAYRR